MVLIVNDGLTYVNKCYLHTWNCWIGGLRCQNLTESA